MPATTHNFIPSDFPAFQSEALAVLCTSKREEGWGEHAAALSGRRIQIRFGDTTTTEKRRRTETHSGEKRFLEREQKKRWRRIVAEKEKERADDDGEE